MKKKFSKFLGVGLALVLLCSFSLVTAVPAAAVDPAVPDRVTAITRTADRLVALQGTDYGWNWVVTDLTAHDGDTSYNLYGVTALGLIDAYEVTTAQSYLDAAGLVADMMIGYGTDYAAFKAAGLGQSFDLRFLMRYAEASNDTSYSDFAKAYWAWVKAREAPNVYADGSQEDFYQFYITIVSPGYAMWSCADFGLAAFAMGDTAWASAMAVVVTTHLAEITDTDDWRFIGWGHALEFLNTVDSAFYATEIGDLITNLKADQVDGSWPGTAAQGAVQNTAYAIMGLAVVGDAGAAQAGADWLVENQINVGTSTGGWIETDPIEYSENDSEALQALAATAAPVTIGTLGYYSIQSAIDAASSGDTISVAAGTYREYLHITTDGLTIEGAGIDESIIDLDGLIPYWHYGTNKSFASRAGVLITGYGSPDEIIEGVAFRGFTVQNAGLNPPITATGTHDGADGAATLTDSTASWADDELVNQWVHNVSDKLIKIDISGNTPIRSYGLITANTATTVTATLDGGLEDDWDNGDTYVIMPYEEYVDVAEDLQDDVRGIGIANGKDIRIQYCKVINSGYGGISVGKARCTNLVQSEGVTIDHCISSYHPQDGIGVGSYIGSVTLTNNTCSNNKRPHPTDPSREYAGVGIQVSGKDASNPISGLIAGNTCNDNGFEGIVLKNYADGVIIENNTVTGSNFDEDGAGIFFYGDGSNPENCQNNIIRNNTVTGNIRGICAYYAQGGTIEGNTITTDSGTFPLGQAAIKIDGGNNITVKDNIISSCDGAGIKVQQTWNDVDCYENTFTGNTITGAKFAGVFISHGAHDNTFEYNTITGTTTLTRWAGEAYEETQGDGVFIWGYTEKEAGPGNVFHNNNIYGNVGDGMENQTGTLVDAEQNWWGDISGPYHATTNPSGTGDPVSDDVHYSTWCAIEDLNLVTPGYQAPTPMVWGVSTDGTIQEAINAADTGDTIIVAAGTYNENIVINEALTVKSTGGVAETIIKGVDNNDYYLVDIRHSDVTFDGFTVTHPTFEGTSDVSGIIVQSRGELVSNVHILDNTVTQVRSESGTASMFAATGINIGAGPLSDIVISGNTITDIKNPSQYTSSCGFDHTCGINVWNGAENIVIYNNTISDIKFNGIILECASDVLIENNPITDCQSGIRLEPREGDISNIRIEENSITGCKYGISVAPETFTLSGLTANFNNIAGNTEYGVANFDLALSVDATYNWWGRIGGPSGESLGNGDNVTANVDYDPWLTENQAKTVSDGIAYFGSTIPLEPGWNTLSVPLKLKDNVDSAKSANTMAEIVGLGDFLISSDTAKNWEIAYQYNPAKTRWDNIGNIKPDIELVPGRGYYIKILGTETVDFPVLYSGELDLPALELSAGWNLIGSAFGIDKTDYGIAATDDVEDGQKPVATALYSIKDKCSVVVSPSTQGQVAAWGTTVIDDTNKMIVGEAYWVFMTAPATLAGFEVTPIYYLP